MAPAAANLGANARDVLAPAEKMTTSKPAGSAVVASSTVTERPAKSMVVPAERAEAKKRAESAQIYADAGRTDAATKERAECAVIEAYLPAAMSDDDVAKIVAEEVANAAAAGATGGKAMGAVVKAVRERVGSGADGQKIAALVKSALG